LYVSSSPETLYAVSFLCPNGTVFDQEIFTCNWWYVILPL
jgi:hypothetical protein